MRQEQIPKSQSQELSDRQLTAAKAKIASYFEERWMFGEHYDEVLRDIAKQMKRSSHLASFVREDIGKKGITDFLKLSYFPQALKEIQLFEMPPDFLTQEPARSALKTGLMRVLRNKHHGEIERTLKEFPFPEQILTDDEVVSEARAMVSEAQSLKQTDLAETIADKFHFSHESLE